MKILELLPEGARQVRYIHPYYEYQEDDEGNVIDEWCSNEDTCTDVWYDIINKVHRTKTPIYYRRRTNLLAIEDVARYSRNIIQHNDREDTWNEICKCVRVRRLGRRVMFIYDEKYMKKLWDKKADKRKLKSKLFRKRKLPLTSSHLNELNFEAIERDIADKVMQNFREEIADEYNS